MDAKLRKIAERPGECPGCRGVGTVICLPDAYDRPLDRACDCCQGSGHQTERQILINRGVNAMILGAMPA